MADAAGVKRRFLIPEVIQTSAMDCGPAALKALFGGYDVYLSYGRLREACQTDVDGTSVDTIESIATQLGMPAIQSMMPADFVLLQDSGCLPAIVVVRLPDGNTHMVVVWRVHGAWVQVMDPGVGRLWLPRQQFMESLYLHEQHVPAEAFREWSQSADFRAAVSERMRSLKVPESTWENVAQQDAALRFAGCLVTAGHLRRGADALRFLDMCAARPEAIPQQYFAAAPLAEDPDSVLLRGAVMIRGSVPQAALAGIPASLLRVRTEAEPQVWQLVRSVLRESGVMLPGMVFGALALAAVGTVLEALLFRGLFDLAKHLPFAAQRLGAVLALVVFLVGLLALEWPALWGASRLGRQLEVGLRRLFVRKIPLLDDRYFQSRLVSDMAMRAHGLQLLRQLPDLAGQVLQLVVSLLATGVAIAWVYPGSVGVAALAVLCACAVPSAFLAPMSERDLRMRETSGCLSSVYFDALQGTRAIQAHGAQSNMHAVYSTYLKRWAAAGLAQRRLAVAVDGLQMLLTYGCVIWLVTRAVASGQSPAGLLLLVYWALSIPSLGQNLAAVMRALPALRNTLVRFLEPLNTPVETGPSQQARDTQSSRSTSGVRVQFEGVDVVVAGHAVLTGVNLNVQPGEHVAIVGLSGAGKSSLLGCLLGWYRPQQGSLRVDDVELDAAALQQLRQETAWIDPQVHLFSGSLYSNLGFGNEAGARMSVAEALDQNDLTQVLSRMPEGLQTPLGEGGTLVSGGEGQRIRAARAFRRNGVRLALLDEPARGLGREQRRGWLATARRRYSNATLFCVTHDIADTVEFDRVIVIEQGSVIEQGAPQLLRADVASRYSQLLAREAAVAHDLWSHADWRRLRLHAGSIHEFSPGASGAVFDGSSKTVLLERYRA